MKEDPKENKMNILEIFKEIRAMNTDMIKFERTIHEEVSDIRETLNNGVTKQTKENSKLIKALTVTVGRIDKRLEKEEGINEGKLSIYKVIGIVLSGFVAGIGATLTIIKILDFLHKI